LHRLPAVVITVAALHLYPVKSCRGYAIESTTLDIRGFAGDRRFLVVDADGRFLTQRLTPRLAPVTPLLSDEALTLTSLDRPPLTLALPVRGAPAREVVIWRDTVQADDCGDEAAAWFSTVLGQPARLVTTGTSFSRPMHAKAAQVGD